MVEMMTYQRKHDIGTALAAVGVVATVEIQPSIRPLNKKQHKIP
jgi:hypothetical protein